MSMRTVPAMFPAQKLSTSRLGERLRRERLRRNELQAPAAARFNVTQPSYSRWESGKIFPDEKHYSDIAQYLGLTVEEVWSLMNDGDPRPISLDSLKSEIADLKRDIVDLRKQLETD